MSYPGYGAIFKHKTILLSPLLDAGNTGLHGSHSNILTKEFNTRAH